jgi:hypothetical protein
MRNDHRRPLVAYGFVALACALVVGQPSLSSLTDGVPGRAPVVTLLTDTGLDAVFGLSIDEARVAVGEIPDDGAVTPGVDPVDDFLGGTPDVIVADGPTPQSGPALSAGLIGDSGGAPGTGTPSGGTGGLPGDGGLFGTPGSDTPRGGKGNSVDDDGPKPHQFGSGTGHPYDTAQTPGKGDPGAGGQDDGKPGQGPKDQGTKDKGAKDKGPKDKGDQAVKGPKDQGSKDKGDKPGKGPKDKGSKHQGKKHG